MDDISFSNEAMLCTFWPVHSVVRKCSIDWQHNTAIQCPHAIVTEVANLNGSKATPVVR